MASNTSNNGNGPEDTAAGNGTSSLVAAGKMVKKVGKPRPLPLCMKKDSSAKTNVDNASGKYDCHDFLLLLLSTLYS